MPGSSVGVAYSGVDVFEDAPTACEAYAMLGNQSGFVDDGIAYGLSTFTFAATMFGASFSLTVKLTFFTVFGPSGVYPGV